MLRRLSVVSVLCGLFLSACSSWYGPPIPPRITRQAPPLPSTPDLESAGALALLRLRNLGEFADRGEAWRQMIEPTAKPGEYREWFAKQGLDPAELTAGLPLGLVLWDAPIGLMNIPAAGLVPTKDAQALGQKLKAGQVKTVPAGDDYALLTQSLTSSNATSESLGKLLAELRQPFASDVQLSLNLIGVERRYGREMDGALKGFADSIPDNDQITSQTRSQLRGQIDMLRATMRQTEAMTFGLALPSEGLEASVLASAREGTDLAGLLRTPRHAWPDLAQMLAPGMLRYQLNLDDPKAFAEHYFALLEPTFAPYGPAVFAEMKRLWGPLADYGPVGLATSMGRKPGSGLTFEMLIMCDRAEELYAQLKELSTGARAREWEKLYERLGMTMKLTDRPAGHLRGAEVMKIHYEFGPWTSLPAQSRQMLDKLFAGGLEAEYVRLGRLILITLNEPLEPLVDRIYARQYTPLESRKALPDGGVMYGDMRLNEYMAFIGDLITPPLPQPFPVLPPDLPALGFGAWAENNRVLGKMHLSRDLVRGVADAVKQKK